MPFGGTYYHGRERGDFGDLGIPVDGRKLKVLSAPLGICSVDVMAQFSLINSDVKFNSTRRDMADVGNCKPVNARKQLEVYCIFFLWTRCKQYLNITSDLSAKRPMSKDYNLFMELCI